LPRFLRSTASFTRIFSHTPAFTHSWKRRWQVWYGGYFSGKSFHEAPVRHIQRIPLRIVQLSNRGRPETFFAGIADSIMGLIKAHCSFFISMAGKFRYQKTISKNYYLTNSHF
jgi:hypothetical protein